MLLREEQYFTFTSEDVVRWAGASVSVNTPLIASELLLTAPLATVRICALRCRILIACDG